MTENWPYNKLVPWKHPECYFGATWYQYAAVYSQHRDSDSLERSNYRVILADLQKRFGDRVVTDTRCNHWAVGWVETIYVRTLCKPAMQAADAWLEKLADYPVADEEDWSNLEWEEAAGYWERLSVRERAEVIRDHGQEASIYAARRGDLPSDSGVFEYLTTP